MRIASRVSVRVPIWLTLTRIELPTPASMPAAQALGVGDEEVVADQLARASPRRLGEQLPAVPVLLVHAVLDRDDRVAASRRRPSRRPSPPARACGPRARARRRRRSKTSLVAGSRAMKTSRAGLVAGRLDPRPAPPAAPPRSTRGRARSRPRRRPRSRARCAARRLLQRVEDLGARSAGTREKLGAPAGTTMNSWKSTELSAWAPPLSTFIIGTGSTRRLAAAVELGEVAVERLRRRRPRRPCAAASETPRIALAPSRALVRGAVELDHRLVERALLGGAGAGQRLGDLAVDVGDRPRDALAGPGVAAVAQLDRLELAGRGAGGHRGAAARAGLERDLDLDRRVAARVEDLARVDGGDGAHGRASLLTAMAKRVRARRSFAGRAALSCGASAAPGGRLRAAPQPVLRPFLRGLRAAGAAAAVRPAV